MSKSRLTDEEVELEIERLKKSKEVKLARLEQRVKYLKRQKLYNLRHLAKRGKELLESGIDEEFLKNMEKDIKGGNKMKLQNLLKFIGHHSYTVMLQMDNFFPPIEIKKEESKNYLDYPVLFVTEDWVITIKGARLV